jgi:hypothetical protein
MSFVKTYDKDQDVPMCKLLYWIDYKMLVIILKISYNKNNYMQ